MSLFSKELLEKLGKNPIVAGFSVENVKDAVPIAEALLEGGIHTIELTLRTEAGLKGLEEICKHVPEITVGVGTILTVDQLQTVSDLGADFGVAPGLNPKVIEASINANFPFAPGIMTPSELEQAISMGCRFVKFFPAESCGGIPYLKSISTPYNHLGIQYFPLGGVHAGNLNNYLALDAVLTVGGSWIVQNEQVREGNFKEISSRAAEAIQAIKQ
jgi:2-dehydro-3-deoxyphosphogluconate aldolase/(4S)-4-hydroxy-2-oxoglutarate aldolase